MDYDRGAKSTDDYSFLAITYPKIRFTHTHRETHTQRHFDYINAVVAASSNRLNIKLKKKISKKKKIMLS